MPPSLPERRKPSRTLETAKNLFSDPEFLQDMKILMARARSFIPSVWGSPLGAVFRVESVSDVANLQTLRPKAKIDADVLGENLVLVDLFPIILFW